MFRVKRGELSIHGDKKKAPSEFIEDGEFAAGSELSMAYIWVVVITRGFVIFLLYRVVRNKRANRIRGKRNPKYALIYGT